MQLSNLRPGERFSFPRGYITCELVDHRDLTFVAVDSGQAYTHPNPELVQVRRFPSRLKVVYHVPHNYAVGARQQRRHLPLSREPSPALRRLQ